MSFIRAEIRFKNAVFTNAFHRQGYKSIAELARRTGISQGLLYSFASLKTIPKNYEIRDKLCRALYEDDYHLFDQYADVVRKNQGVAPKMFKEISKDKFVSLESAEVLLLEDKDALVDQAMNKESLEIDVRLVLKTLKDRERMVLEMSFGFEPYGYSRTLNEIAEKLGLTRERVRQIKDLAIRRLKHRSRSNVLAYYTRAKPIPANRPLSASELLAQHKEAPIKKEVVVEVIGDIVDAGEAHLWTESPLFKTWTAIYEEQKVLKEKEQQLKYMFQKVQGAKEALIELNREIDE